MPLPVERALRRLGQDISTARRMRRLSQEDLARRIGPALSTVRRLEDGYPGTALHTFLRALQVLGRLDAMTRVMAMEHDAHGMELIRERLPQRVRTSPESRRRLGHSTTTTQEGGAVARTDDLEGF